MSHRFWDMSSPGLRPGAFIGFYEWAQMKRCICQLSWPRQSFSLLRKFMLDPCNATKVGAPSLRPEKRQRTMSWWHVETSWMLWSMTGTASNSRPPFHCVETLIASRHMQSTESESIFTHHLLVSKLQSSLRSTAKHSHYYIPFSIHRIEILSHEP